MIQYKGYTATLEVDPHSGLIVGAVIGTRDQIVFHGRTVDEARESFARAVDFYLESRDKAGREPEKPFSGKFNVRIPAELHRGLVLDSEARKLSLNDVVKLAFAQYLERSGPHDPDDPPDRTDRDGGG